MGKYIALLLTNAARVALAAGAMLVIGVALWFVAGVLTSLVGVQTGTVVLTFAILIAVVAISAGSYASVRYITPGAWLHPVFAALAIALAFVALTMRGNVGSLRVVVPLGAGAVAAIAALVSIAGRQRSP